MATKKRSTNRAARESFNRMVKEADERRRADQHERTARLAEKAKAYWPYFIGHQDEPIIASFLEHCTPESVLDEWRTNMRKLGIDPAVVVQTVRIRHASLAAHWRDDPFRIAGWWPKGQVPELHRRLSAWFDFRPNMINTSEAHLAMDLGMGLMQQGVGLRTTAEHLAQAGSDTRRVGAVMILGSLFHRTESTRRHFPRETWPNFHVAETLREWMWRVQDARWHSSCVDTLPEHHAAWDCEIDSMHVWLETLAYEHALTLHGCVPVRVQLVGEDEPRDPPTPLRPR